MDASVWSSLLGGMAKGYRQAKQKKQESEQKNKLSVSDLIKQYFWKKYQEGDRSPGTEKAIGAFVKPEVLSPNQEAKTLTGVMGDVLNPSSLPEDKLKEILPLIIGNAGGGEVLSPPGATYDNGQITSPSGENIGEYSPGSEPKTATDAVSAVLRSLYGVGKNEAARGFLGLPGGKKTSSGGIGNIDEVLKGILSDTSGKSKQYTSNEQIQADITAGKIKDGDTIIVNGKQKKVRLH